MGILLMEKKKYILEFEEDPTTIRLVKLKNGENGLPCMQFVAVSPYKYDEAYQKGVHDTATEIEAIKDEAYNRGRKDAIDEVDTEKIRKEAYDKGYKDATEKIGSDEQAITDKAYKQGLSDAWKCVDRIFDMPCKRREQIFSECDSVGVWDILHEYSASEAIEKIRQYEQEKEDDHDREKVAALADDIGIHKLYALVREIRGE